MLGEYGSEEPLRSFGLGGANMVKSVSQDRLQMMYDEDSGSDSRYVFVCA